MGSNQADGSTRDLLTVFVRGLASELSARDFRGTRSSFARRFTHPPHLRRTPLRTRLRRARECRISR